MKWIFGLIFCAAAVLFCSCRSFEPDPNFRPGPDDKLTRGELDGLMFHARQFVASAGNVKLTEAERALVRGTSPVVQIKYLGPKYGRIRLEWRLEKNKQLTLTGLAELTRKDFPWKLEIDKSYTTHPVPPDVHALETYTLPLPKAEKF